MHEETLRGAIGDFPLPDVLRFLALTRKSGILSVTRPHVSGRVDVCEGEVCFAVSDATRMALGSRLVGAGVLSPDQLRRLLAGPSVNLGQLLVESGQLDDDRRDRLVREQIVDAVCELALWPEGTFSLAPGQPTDLGVRVNVEQLAAEAAQRRVEWSALQERLASPDAVLAIVPHPADGVIGLDTEQWRLLAFINAQRTVAEVVELSGWSEYTTWKVLASLVDAGLVEAAVPASGIPLRLGEIVAGQELLRRLEREHLAAPTPASQPQAEVEPVALPPAPAPPAPAQQPALEQLPVLEPARQQLPVQDPPSQQLPVPPTAAYQPRVEQPPGHVPAAPPAQHAVSSPLEVAAEQAVAAQPDAPRIIDRSAVARELAALGLEPAAAAERPSDDPPPPPTPAPPQPRDPHPDANRGLLSRLMGGRHG